MKKIKILIPLQNYLKLKYYTMLCPMEISGLGKISYSKKDKNNIKIEDIFIFPQKVGYSSTDLDKKSIALFLEKEYSKNKTISDIKIWWHSHADMPVSFSPRDERTIENFGETSDFIVSLVVNHKMDMTAKIDIFNPFRNTIEDVDIEITSKEDKILENKIKKELEKNIKMSKRRASWLKNLKTKNIGDNLIL